MKQNSKLLCISTEQYVIHLLDDPQFVPLTLYLYVSVPHF